MPDERQNDLLLIALLLENHAPGSVSRAIKGSGPHQGLDDVILDEALRLQGTAIFDAPARTELLKAVARCTGVGTE